MKKKVTKALFCTKCSLKFGRDLSRFNTTFAYNLHFSILHEKKGLQIPQNGQHSKCPICEKSYKSTSILKHIKSHNIAKQEKFPCPDGCKLIFTTITRRNMHIHLKNVHKSKEPYVCKQCQKRYESLKILNGHLAKHRAEKNLDQEMAEEAFENKVTYVCKFPGCGKYFNKVYQIKELLLHKRLNCCHVMEE